MEFYKERCEKIQEEMETVREQLTLSQEAIARLEHSEKEGSLFDEREEHLLRL